MHMLPGRGRCLSAVVPALPVADSCGLPMLFEHGLPWPPSSGSTPIRRLHGNSEINPYFALLTVPEAYSTPRFSSRWPLRSLDGCY
ncbi:hypothetical protein EDB19DRAFT_2022462 [Suillus lakei]|nr:hypothetical protein EDB19DRAFT_2022462 [Suillus lakei]